MLIKRTYQFHMLYFQQLFGRIELVLAGQIQFVFLDEFFRSWNINEMTHLDHYNDKSVTIKIKTLLNHWTLSSLTGTPSNSIEPAVPS